MIGLALFFLILKKAAFIPITHDEQGTIDYFSKMPIWDIISYKDPIPNNHILNTLLIKFFSSLFGYHPFVVRLPNVLAFVLYFTFCVHFIKGFLTEPFIRIAALLLLTANPYFIDFFSLARGYALSVSLQMASLYFFLSNFKEFSFRQLYYSLGLGILAVYANFTLLNYFLPLALLTMVQGYLYFYDNNRKAFQTVIVATVVFTVFILSLIVVPISKMVATKQLQFWGSNGFYDETIKSSSFSYRHNVPYFDWMPDSFPLILTLSILFLISISFVLLQKKKTYHIFSIVLLVLVTIYNIVQFHVFDTPYLNARTSLFFIPLLCIPVVFSIQHLLSYNKVAALLLSLFLGGFAFQHFVRSYNVKHSFEWYFDANTYEVLDFLKEYAKNNQLKEPIRLNVNWIFHPSFMYHSEKDYPNLVVINRVNNGEQPKADYNFYYIQNGEWEKLKNEYDLIKDFSWGMHKLVRKK